MLITVASASNAAFSRLSITAPDYPEGGGFESYAPRNIVIAFDKSGSMSESANPNGAEETKLYTKMDLAKRGVEILALGLTENDSLSIITYDSFVRTPLPLTKMDAEGKEKVKVCLAGIQPGGCTALWEGLKAAMDAVKDVAGKNKTVILLTDGLPSESPSVGEVAALEAYRKTTENKCFIHTIGFGNDVNSDLLSKLGGSFLYISDGSMVITNFVNFLANEQTIAVDDAVIVVTKPDWTTTTIPIGAVRYGQSRDVVVDYQVVHAIMPGYVSKFAVENDENWVFSEVNRVKAITALKNALRIASMDIDDAKTILKASIAHIMNGDNGMGKTPNIPIIEDFIGEVAKAFSDNNWTKWGKNYIITLISAHALQVRTNRMDPGLIYGGEMYHKRVDALNTLCDSLPVPVPSGNSNSSFGFGTNGATGLGASMLTLSQQQFTHYFNSADGGCFAGTGLVSMADGSTKRVDEIVKGDVVRTADGETATIECVVQFTNVRTLTINNGLKVTPWHPVFINNVWMFPADLAFHDAVLEHNDMVTTFILAEGDRSKLPIIDGIAVCTLGHNIKGPVIEHAFYGTDKIVNDLKSFPSWSTGTVCLSSNNHVYNANNVIVGYA